MCVILGPFQDLVVELKIPSADEAMTFVYKLGAQRLHGILNSTCNEAIRRMVYSVPHNEAMDLSGTSPATVEIVNGLNQKLAAYGVNVRSVIVTRVRLPPILQERLERTTAFKTEIEEAEKRQENKLLVLNHKATQDLEALKRDNDRQVQALTVRLRPDTALCFDA